MPKLTATAAVLIVNDVPATVDYFRNAVGFDADVWGDPPDFAICKRDNQHLMLAKAKDATHIKPFWHFVPIQDLDGHDIGFGQVLGR